MKLVVWFSWFGGLVRSVGEKVPSSDSHFGLKYLKYFALQCVYIYVHTSVCVWCVCMRACVCVRACMCVAVLC